MEEFQRYLKLSKANFTCFRKVERELDDEKEKIVGEIGKKGPGVTLEAYPVPHVPGQGSPFEDLSPSPIPATSAEAIASPSQDATPTEDEHVLPPPTWGER
ncbi:hypothetical protein AgCh_010722 [Apium graveolens]